jgi:hypothetical protein
MRTNLPASIAPTKVVKHDARKTRVGRADPQQTAGPLRQGLGAAGVAEYDVQTRRDRQMNHSPAHVSTAD